ncbi:hypothetical protein M5K25_026572 [Dendrobium thyrsiflorum]|uniref:Uncharacterized protein n=1 Tax=Dendrobium thyrsiflorum TaxID=117978 RepID=A0ABD0TXN8_DENTH
MTRTNGKEVFYAKRLTSNRKRERSDFLVIVYVQALRLLWPPASTLTSSFELTAREIRPSGSSLWGIRQLAGGTNNSVCGFVSDSIPSNDDNSQTGHFCFQKKKEIPFASELSVRLRGQSSSRILPPPI